ncbi:MAG: hypothetical protein PQJ59_01845 [Spirochaetales bacterium]|nr:hypothetical protein [Spirochaetales bacterium]
MKDLQLVYSDGAPDIEVVNGMPKMSGGLSNAVYLSLFVSEWWGNSESETEEKFISEIPEILVSNPLTNQTRLNIIEAAQESLSWMIDLGIAAEIEITASIPSKGTLNLAVEITEPEQDESTNFTYALNWDAQEVFMKEEE